MKTIILIIISYITILQAKETSFIDSMLIESAISASGIILGGIGGYISYRNETTGKEIKGISTGIIIYCSSTVLMNIAISIFQGTNGYVPYVAVLPIKLLPLCFTYIYISSKWNNYVYNDYELSMAMGCVLVETIMSIFVHNLAANFDNIFRKNASILEIQGDKLAIKVPNFDMRYKNNDIVYNLNILKWKY